jgi:predicted ATP-dependent serine protease
VAAGGLLGFYEEVTRKMNGSQAMHEATSGLRSCVPTGLLALDRVLGGGLVEGSTTLLVGRLGAGISTLALQARDGFGQRCLKHLIDYAKMTGTTLWLDIAGPRAIVHDVDVELRLDQEDDEWILSCPGKNRFGPTNVVERLKLTAEGFVDDDEEANASIEISHGASS